MAQVIDVEDNNCSLRSFERNRYFFGKPLMVRDFDAEQSYFNGKRYLLNRLIHGGGIICGLVLTANEDGGFTLKAGSAIDCCGREIVVGSDYSKSDLTELEGYRDELINQKIYFCLQYDECIREPVHTNANTSSCTDICDYNRIREGFKVIMKATGPTARADYCEVTSSKKIVFEDTRVRIERVAPLWVNPKDVFEVRLVATRKSVSGKIEINAQEGFSPANQLTVVQGISPLTNRVNLTLEDGEATTQRSYLLRASESIITTQINATVFFPASSEQAVEAQSSVIEITAAKISDRIVGKIFKDEELGACSACTEDHCLYLASATLGENSQLGASIELFPASQYVYNNPLLFELLACGENRIGKLPEIPVSNATAEVVAAVTAFKFFDGLTAADGGLGQANVTAKVNEGLKIESDAVVADLGKGLIFDGNHIAANIGNGLKFDGEQIQPDYSTANDAGKVCQANDPRLSNAREPLPHAATHQNGGTDELNVLGLSGLLQDAQKLEVQDEGTTRGTRPKLNFVGPGVTVADDAAQNRVTINIPQAGNVSTGLIRFLDMRNNELRLSSPIAHGQETNTCALVFSMAMIEGEGEYDAFGESPFSTLFTPIIYAVNVTSQKAFYVYLKDRRPTDERVVTYLIRWWAIPKDIDTPLIIVPPPEQRPNLNLIPNDIIRFNTVFNPGLSREELATSLGVKPKDLDEQLKSLKDSNRIRVEDDKIFPE